MEINKKLMKRQIGGETFLVPLGKSVYDTNGLFFLTELGGFIWDLLPQVQSEEEIVKAILEEYDVEQAQAAEDVSAFFGKLRELEIID